MDLVLQLKTTPRKTLKPTSKDTTATIDDVPNALGLVPKTPDMRLQTTTPSKPDSSGKKTRIKAVQRNLLDEDGFSSPLKTSRPSPVKKLLTPLKLKTSPGKSRYHVTPTR